jgi:hypothetical protein
MSLRITDYDRLLIARPVNEASTKVTSGGVAREGDNWRGWARREMGPRSAIDRGPPVVGVAPATATSRRDELVAHIRWLDRQIKQTAMKQEKRALGRQKAAAEQELHLLYRQGRPRQEHPHE